jgi:hypothetical protein
MALGRRTKATGAGGPEGGAAIAGVVPRERSLLWLHGLLCGALVALALPTAILAAGLLGPAVAMFAIDAAPGRSMGRAALLFGAAGSVGTLFALWDGGHAVPLALGLLFDPASVGLAWGTSACGWLAAEALPVLVRVGADMLAASRAARLRAEISMHEAAWKEPAA